MADLIIVIVAGCDAMNTTVRIGFCEAGSASRPSGLDRRQSYRGTNKELISFGLAVAPFDWWLLGFELVGGHTSIAST